jgi:PAS domain S-box-containing protein
VLPVIQGAQGNSLEQVVTDAFQRMVRVAKERPDFMNLLFIELVEGKRDQYTAEKRYLRKDGGIFWGRVNFSAVRGADGRPLYTIGMIEDITEEKQAAEKLAAQEAGYRRMLEQRIAERTEELNKLTSCSSRKHPDAVLPSALPGARASLVSRRRSFATSR